MGKTDVDRLIRESSSTRKDLVGRHETSNWLGRVPKEDLPAVMRFLRQFHGEPVRAIYRDRKDERSPKTNRYPNGWAYKKDATHADIYSTGTSITSGLSPSLAWMLRSLKAGAKMTPAIKQALASDAMAAFRYATLIANARFPPGEEAIAKSKLAKNYLARFPEAQKEWTAFGYTDVLGT